MSVFSEVYVYKLGISDAESISQIGEEGLMNKHCHSTITLP